MNSKIKLATIKCTRVDRVLEIKVPLFMKNKKIIKTQRIMQTASIFRNTISDSLHSRNLFTYRLSQNGNF